MNDIKVFKVKKLFAEKKFEEAIVFIENSFSNIEKTSEILNILGVCKLQKKNFSNFDLLSAIKNFRDCYLKEKNTHSKKEFFNEEQTALKPFQKGLFDDLIPIE